MQVPACCFCNLVTHHWAQAAIAAQAVFRNLLMVPCSTGTELRQLSTPPLMHLQVIVTVFSRPQLGAVLGRMEKEAAERWGRQLSQGGHPGRCTRLWHLVGKAESSSELLIPTRMQCGSVSCLLAVHMPARHERTALWNCSLIVFGLVLRCRTEWEVLDLQDVVVHVFTAEQREFYEIESFYGAAEEVDLPFLQQDSTTGTGSGVAVDWRSS